MCAYRADLGSLLPHYKMPAVAAFPHGLSGLFEYLLHLNVLEKLAVPCVMSLLDLCDHPELLCKSGKALFFRILRKAFIHIGPLVVFTVGSAEQVLRRVPQYSKRLEPELCMLLLVIGGLFEYGSDLLISFLPRYRGEIGVLVPCHGFAG